MSPSGARGNGGHIVAGIDPGLARTGYGVLAIDGEDVVVLASGTIVTRPNRPVEQRLVQLHDEIEAVFQSLRPEVVAVERLFLGRNRTSAMAVGEARGIVLLAAGRVGARVIELTPQKVKQMITGLGRGEKSQVAYMVRVLLHLRAPLGPDEADALAAALCAARLGEDGVQEGQGAAGEDGGEEHDAGAGDGDDVAAEGTP